MIRRQSDYTKVRFHGLVKNSPTDDVVCALGSVDGAPAFAGAYRRGTAVIREIIAARSFMAAINRGLIVSNLFTALIIGGT